MATHTDGQDPFEEGKDHHQEQKDLTDPPISVSQHTVAVVAYAAGACVLIDGAQAPSTPISTWPPVTRSTPTDVGAVYGKPEVLEKMPPWHGGGNMIRDLTFENSTFQVPPGRFEAGNGNIADAIGFGTAVDYLERMGLETWSATSTNCSATPPNRCWVSRACT